VKTLLKHFIIDTVSLYLISLVVSGITFADGTRTLLLAGLGLMATTLIARPIIGVLLLPLNLITFGLFKWVASAISLYLVTIVVPGFKLTNFYFAGASSAWIGIPAISLTGPLAFVAFSFLISLVSSLVYWIFK